MSKGAEAQRMESKWVAENEGVSFENEVEEYLASRLELLGLGVELLGRQVDLEWLRKPGRDQGRTADLLAISRVGRLCIIEIKRDEGDDDALKQLLGYAALAGGFLEEDLNCICQRKNSGQTLADFWQQRFKRNKPRLKLNKPLLVLVANEFTSEFADLVGFLNQLYKMDVLLYTYKVVVQPATPANSHAGGQNLDTDAKGDIQFNLFLSPDDMWLPEHDQPEHVLLVWLDEGTGQLWEDWVQRSYIAVRGGFQAIVRLAATKSDSMVFVYLKRCGLVGMGRLMPTGTDGVVADVADAVQFEVKWECAIRDLSRAWHLPVHLQPTTEVVRLLDYEQWRLYSGKMQWLSRTRSQRKPKKYTPRQK